MSQSEGAGSDDLSRVRPLVEASARGADTVNLALSRLCRAATADLGLLGAVVTVVTDTNAQAVIAFSDAKTAGLEEIQMDVGEGPTLDAHHLRRPVLVADLAGSLPRWTGYVTEALRAGVGAVFSFPLQLGAARFGVLSCYANRRRDLTPSDLSSLVAFAELATEIVLAPDTSMFPEDAESRLLDGAHHLHSEIYQAQGMVVVALEVGLVEALDLMRAHAFARGLSLTALSQGIVARSIDLSVPPRDGER